MRLSSRLAFDVALLAAVVSAALISLTYDPRAGRVPFVVALIGAGLLLVQCWLDLRRAPEGAEVSGDGASVASGGTADAEGAGDAGGSEDSEDAEDDSEIGWRWPVYTLLALVGLVFLVWLVGYLIAVPVFAVASLILLGRVGWKTSLLVSAGLWAFVYVLLEVLLRANLS